MSLRGQQNSIIQNCKMSIYKEGFLHRGVALLNKLSEDLRNEEKLEKFKVKLRKWVLENVPVRPEARFPKFESREVTKEVS